MEVRRSGSQPFGQGPAEYFTGNVRIDPLFEAPHPARARGATVTFEPGARIAPVGTPNGIIDWPIERFGTKRAGNSVPPMLAELAGRGGCCPTIGVKVTK